MTNNDLDLPELEFPYSQVKDQTARMTVDLVRWNYALTLLQTGDDTAINRAPDFISRPDEQEIYEMGINLIDRFNRWFSLSPVHKYKGKTWAEQEAENDVSQIQDAMQSYLDGTLTPNDTTDIVLTLDTIRDSLHRSTGFRNEKYLHYYNLTAYVDGDPYIVERRDPWLEHNMPAFSQKVADVIQDLDLSRNIGRRLTRQSQMRQLYRQAGIRPAIPEARIIHRETPLLDRVQPF